jgi:hypothetical protein
MVFMKIIKFLFNVVIPQSKIEGYNVLATKTIFPTILKIMLLLLLCPTGIIMLLATDENIKVQISIHILASIFIILSIYLLFSSIYNIVQPRILIYENGDSLIINNKYLVNIKDITSFSRKNAYIYSYRRKNYKDAWWGTIYIIVDDKKFVIRNVDSTLKTIDYLYRKKKQKKYNND